MGLALLICTVGMSPAAPCPDTANPSPPAVAGTNDLVSFTAGSLIIPMDSCYQRPGFMSNSDITAIIPTAGSEECNSNAEKDDGIIPAYTLMFRLVEAGIPVFWSIKAGKTGWHDTDFTVTKAAGAPVSHRSLGGSENATKYSALTAIKYRGAPFIIEQANAAAALTLMDSLTTVCDTGTCYDEVDVHIAQADFDAPIKTEIGALPKIAVIDISDATTNLKNEKTNFTKQAITVSLMADLEGTVFDFLTIPQVNAGDLVSGDYNLAWVPSFELYEGVATTSAQLTFIASLNTYADAGGAILFQDGAVGAMEGYGDFTDPGYSEKLAPSGAYMSAGGLDTGGISSTWDNGSTNETVVSDDYSDPASQFGGMVWTGIGGSKHVWAPRCDADYADGVRRMLYTDHLTDDSKDNFDQATWRKKDNDPNKGTIYYLGGSNWRRVTAAGFRLLMNSVLAESTDVADLGTIESARSAPIVATVDGDFSKFVGTFNAPRRIASATTFASMADAPDFFFPDLTGHYRALDMAVVEANPSATTYEELELISGAIRFDTAINLPSMTIDTAGQGCAFPADATCRRIFTNSGTTILPLTLGNQAALEPTLGFTTPEAEYLIGLIHEGADDGASGFQAALGGIDRSTAAVIEASTAVGGIRPTIAYVGGTDGMMHAICATDTVGVCTGKIGNELWAFMPDTELGKVATNTTRIDGSPKVSDVFGDFGGATKEYRTVLAFQTGNTGSAATYALDITDPADPSILWTNSTAGSGTILAMSTILVPGEGLVHVTYSQTSDDSGGTAGMEVVATRTDSGTVLWSWTTPYDAVRVAATAAIPTEAFPGGPTLVSSVGDDLADTVLVPTLWGSVYSLSAAGDSSSPGDPVVNNGGNPIFAFSDDYHPIGAPVSIYSSANTGTLHVVAVTGGFNIPASSGLSAASWSPSDENQYAVGFPLETGGTIDETSALIDITIDFGPGNRAFSQAVIAGNEIFVVTDTGNVNAANYGAGASTGSLFQGTLTDGSSASASIASGGGGIDVRASDGAVYTGAGAQAAGPPQGTADVAGTALGGSATDNGKRFLWLSSH